MKYLSGEESEKGFIPRATGQVISDPALVAAIAFPNDPEAQKMLRDASERMKAAGPKRYVQVVEGTEMATDVLTGTVIPLTLAGKTSPVEQISRAVKRANENPRSPIIFDTLVCGEDLAAQMNDRLYGVTIHAAADAAAARTLANELACQGKRVLLVEADP